MQIVKLICIICIASAVASCRHRQDSDRHLLAVSIEPQRHILEQLAGPSFEVTSLLGRSTDPETFDPSTAQRMAVDRADIYFATGVLPFENRLHASLNPACTYIDTSEGIELLHGTHGKTNDSHADHSGHNDADPHYWSSVANIRHMASTMAAALKERYPDSTRIIDARLEKLGITLDSLDTVIRTKTGAAKTKSFAVWHPSLSYFARDYGLHQHSFGMEGKEMSARDMATAIDKARTDSIEVFIFQPAIDSRQAEVLSHNIGSRLVSVDLQAYDWLDQLSTIADEINRQN